MVPSGATAGAILIPGRCEPQRTVGGCWFVPTTAAGGHGKVLAPENWPGQVVAVPAGAAGMSVAKDNTLVASPGVIFTSQAPSTSVPGISIGGIGQFDRIVIDVAGGIGRERAGDVGI